MNSQEKTTADHSAQDLVKIFNELFMRSFSTVLEGGGDEPIYLPAKDAQEHNRIVFTRDYYASALHEISHWCIAGEVRRQQIDYGYWYEPDGRSIEQQRAFEKVEVEPQALEWLFSAAAGVKFRVSADNLNGDDIDTSTFAESVKQQVVTYIANGLTGRAGLFCQSLVAFYQRESAFDDFCNEMLNLQRPQVEKVLPEQAGMTGKFAAG